MRAFIAISLLFTSIICWQQVTAKSPSFSLAPSVLQDSLSIQGKALFKENCRSCHRLKKKWLGPPLAGITQWREEAWLRAHIRSAAKHRASGDSLALASYATWKKREMKDFEWMSPQQITALLVYLEKESK